MKNMKFNEILTKTMAERGVTQKKLADLLGTTQQTISRWTKGVNEPDIAALIILADFFDVSIDYLTGRENEDGTKAYKIKQP